MAVIKIYLSNDGVNYTSTFENTLKEFSSICEKGSYQIPLGWSYGGTHKTNTFKVTLSGDPYYITEFEKYKHIKVTKDGTIVFLGSSPTFSKTIEKKDYFEATATYSDYSKSFEDQRFDSSDDWQWTITEADGWKVCDGNNTAKSLAHYLFNKLDRQGLFTLHCTYTDISSVKYFHVEGKDKVQRVFSEFLKQNALAYYVCNKDVYIVDVLENIQGTATTIPNIEGGATISEKPFIERKVPYVRFSQLTTKYGEQVYDSGEVSVNSAISGDNFYPSSTTYATAECSYKDVGKDEEVVAYRNVRYNFWTQGSINPDLLIKGESRPTPDGARSGSVSGKGFDFMVDNDNWTLRRKFRLTFTATVDILSYANLVKPQDGTLWDGDEKKCEYIFSTASANRYINALLYQKDAEAKIYNFYSDLDLALNSICVIQNVTKQAEFIRITDKIDNLDDFGGYTYKGVPYSGEGVVTDGQYVPVEYTAPSTLKDFYFTADKNYVIVDSGIAVGGQSITFTIKLKEYIGTPTLTVNGVLQTLQRVTSEEDDSVDGKAFTCLYTPSGALDRLSAIANLDGEIKEINFTLIDNSVVESITQYYISLSTEELIPAYEGADWEDTLPSYEGKVWRRTKNVYASGGVSYGEPFYLMQGEDVASAFVIRTQYAISESNSDPSEIISWEDRVPSGWHAGMYIWTRDVITYESDPNNPVIGEPVCSFVLTQERLSSCEFTITPSTLTYDKDLRSTALVLIPISVKSVGYELPVTPTFTIRAVDANGNTVIDSRIVVSNGVLNVPKNAEIASVTVTATIAYTDMGESVPVFASFSISSNDVTQKGKYLGCLSSLPADIVLDGDHFVPSVDIVIDSVTHDKYIPLVYLNGSWSEPAEGVEYGSVSFAQIIYDSARDIFSNAGYKYAPVSGVAVSGASYYRKDDNLYSLVAVPVGQSVAGLYVKELDVPPEVERFYSYQKSILATYIGVNDIELVNDGNNIGMIRSEGYARGTVEAMINAGSAEGFKQGFFGGADGHLEAFKALFFKARMYQTDVEGELHAQTFETQPVAIRDSQISTNSILAGTKYWTTKEALNAIRGASGWVDNQIMNLETRYPANTSNNARSKAIYVTDNTAVYGSGTLVAGASTPALPFPARVYFQGGLWKDGVLQTSGTKQSRGAVLTNKGKWDVADLYSQSFGSYMYGSGLTWNGVNKHFAKVTDTSKQVTAPVSSKKTYVDTGTFVETLTIPAFFLSGRVSFSITNMGGGSCIVKKNGAVVATHTFSGGISSDMVFSYESSAVKTGDVFETTIVRSSLGAGIYGVQAEAQTFAQSGFSLNGFYTFDYSNGQFSNIKNWGTSGAYYQDTDVIIVTSPLSWKSEDYYTRTTYSYTLELFSNGLNLLNDLTYEKEQVVPADTFFTTATYLRAVFGGTVVVDSDSPTGIAHYYKFRGLVQEGNVLKEGAVYSIETASLSIQRYEEDSTSFYNNVKSVVWSNGDIVISFGDDTAITVLSSDFLISFELTFTPFARQRGNYTETIIPKTPSANRVEEINFGNPLSRVDKAYIDELFINGSQTPLSVGSISDSVINELQ